MKKERNVRPPRWASRFLAWYCRPELLEDLEGDLHEYFERNVKLKGARRARLIYIIDVIKFLRLYTLRKPEFINLLTHQIMIGSYVKTAGRNIVRNKLFSSINIIGLSVSMSVGLIMIAMLFDAFSYDKLHEKHDRIYRVISQYQHQGNKNDDFFATTSLRAARAIKESTAGPEDVAIFQRDFSGDVTFHETTVFLSGFYANQSLFNVFSFPLIQGDAATALTAPFSVVLTEQSAHKLFGRADALGKTVTFKDREYTITGILKDIPTFSHIKFDMLASLSTKELTNKEQSLGLWWNDMWETWAYVLMPAGADITGLKENMHQLAERENEVLEHEHHARIELDLQPLDDIMTGKNLSNQIGPALGSTMIWVFASLSFIVVLSACFNYTNLSIARSLSRSREVGIRKTIGAQKSHVIGQFIIESVVISLLALVFSFILFMLIRPEFLSLEPSLRELLVLDLSPTLIAFFILFAVTVGISAGFFPALFFARVNAVRVLKKLSVAPAFKGLTLRKVLIVFQYSLSIIGITATLIIYKQFKHFVTYDLGFTTENILNIRLKGNTPELLKKELQELPEVMGISESKLITSIGNYWSANMKNPDSPDDSATVYCNFIDENYLPLHGHRIIAGHNFRPRADSAANEYVIVNEQVLKRFNIAGQDPFKAIGEVVKLNSQDVTITGVVKDFKYGQANNNTGKEVILRYSGDNPEYLNIKILSNNWPETYARIETIWKRTDPVHSLDAKFYKDQIEEAFVGLKASAKVGGFLALLVVCIASIGLLGMVVFTTETRIKEISIRKVFGAGETRLLFLLSKGFLFLLFIAAAIALPLTYLFFDRILLPSIANHAPVGLSELLTGVFAVMCIALLMMGSQTLKVARSNPARVLKAE